MLADTLVFDIETIPDIAGGRKLLGLETLDDDAVAKALFAKREQEAGTSILRHHLQRIVAISIVFYSKESVKVCSLGDLNSDEKTLLTLFFRALEKYTPTLVSWNGTGFDLPVIHYRGLIHGLSAPRYWETGEHEQSFKWNNYLNRYHYRHLDIMDILAGYQPRNNARLDEIACLIGYPGKVGMDGSQVWPHYQQGKLAEIRHYCETDVLNTFLIYLRFELFRGNLSQTQYNHACEHLKAALQQEQKPHLDAFLQVWQADNNNLTV
ncbi:MAG: 3-5 exonuclease [Gammaproteobacteria bacterium]|nr:3-5 exonuclease [Gammaproteobacteria bacterium]